MELKRFITVITAVHYVHLFWSKWIHSMPTHPILILSSHPYIALPSGRFHQSFLAERLQAGLITIHIPCTPQSCHPLSDDLNNICQWSQIMKLLTVQFSANLCCSVLGPNIFLSTLVLNDHRPLFSPSERPGFTPIYNRQNCISICFDLYVLRQQKRKQKIVKGVVGSIFCI